MSDIVEEQAWTDGVYQLEVTDPVQGGPEGIDNLPHKHLANRTLWLKKAIETLTTSIKGYALLGGSETQRFKVAAAVNKDEAVNRKQMEEAISSLGLPIGHHYLQIRETPYDNELVQHGGEFLREDFPKLWEFIQTQTSLLLTDEDWQIENTANGMCGFFSSGDGSTTFRLMNLDEAMLIAVNSTTNAVGGFRGGEIKSHSHAYVRGSNFYPMTQGGFGTMWYGELLSASTATGGAKNTVDRIGALPLIIAK